MTIIGYRDSKFTTPSGENIQGVSLYLTEPRNGVYGLACDRLFVSTNKLSGYIPVCGDEVQIFYNRYGKVDHLDLINRQK